MVTAILPAMTGIKATEDLRSPAPRTGRRSHAIAPSISSELTITPARFRSQSPTTDGMRKRDTVSSTSQLAGLVGMFTGCGALVALLLFLPLPTRFTRAGKTPAAAIADTFYVVGAIALVVAVGCFFGLRNLPAEEDKGFHRLVQKDSNKSSETTTSKQPILSYPRQFLASVQLGFKSRNIGLGYLGGFVARASSVAISLFIPLFTNTYFLKIGDCKVNPSDPSNPSDIKYACPQAYRLAAELSGISQFVALLCAPLFGYLSGKYPKFNIPLLVASLAGIVGYSAFGSLASPDPHSKNGSGAVFFIVSLMGISQIGAIVCSLALLGRGIHNDEGNDEFHSVETSANGTGHPSAGATPPRSPPLTPTGEDAPLLMEHDNYLEHPDQSSSLLAGSKSHTYLKGSIAGTYSLLGGFGILLLTKAGGALFDAAGPGAPFYMMASFNGLLLVVGIGAAAWEVIQGRGKQEHDIR